MVSDAPRDGQTVCSAIGPGSGVLLVGHGTREPAGVGAFFQLTRTIQQAVGLLPVEPAFLELAEPTIDTAIDRLVGRGARRLTIVPMLLFAAGHVKRDIPALVAQSVQRHPGLTTWQTRCLGCHKRLIELSVLRCREALTGQTIAGQTTLVMIGRGSHDPTANARMYRFARLRWEHAPMSWLEVGFIAMARPTLEETLAVAARLPAERIVVQPHLLFDGELWTRVRESVDKHSARFRDKQWVCTGPLGVHSLLVETVLSRIGCKRPMSRRNGFGFAGGA
jgi:sirohydrochlorin cobaltochelatase